MTKDLRRHHKNRMRKKMSYIWHNVWGNKDHDDIGEDKYPGNSKRNILLMAETRKPCSKYCCGNPRKHFKTLTKQEKLSNADYKDQIRNKFY